MSPGQAPAGGIGAPGPSAPTSRPLWLLILSSITLVQGGLTLVSGLTIVRDPVEAAAKLPPLTRPLSPDEEALNRELAAVGSEIVSRYSTAVRGCGVAAMALALLMLYGAAAALLRDRHGRRAMLLVAWAGIAYRVGTLPITIPFAHELADATAPIQVRHAATTSTADGGPATAPTASAPTASARDGAATAGGAGVTPPASTPTASPEDKAEPPLTLEAQISLNRTTALGLTIVSALLGVIGSLLLIGYFGGRRGRALYGLPPRLG